MSKVSKDAVDGNERSTLGLEIQRLASRALEAGEVDLHFALRGVLVLMMPEHAGCDWWPPESVVPIDARPQWRREQDERDAIERRTREGTREAATSLAKAARSWLRTPTTTRALGDELVLRVGWCEGIATGPIGIAKHPPLSRKKVAGELLGILQSAVLKGHEALDRATMPDNALDIIEGVLREPVREDYPNAPPSDRNTTREILRRLKLPEKIVRRG